MVEELPKTEASDPGRGKVVVVDDEEAIVETLVDILKQESFEAIGFTDPEKALEWAQAHGPEVVLSDLQVPKIHG
jgi:two-component system response regulator MtrA